MLIKITPRERSSGPAPHQVADAELHFTEGPLTGLKLIGFTVWQGRDGRRTVVFPSRFYSVNGERRAFALLRDSGRADARTGLTDVILAAYHDFIHPAA